MKNQRNEIEAPVVRNEKVAEDTWLLTLQFPRGTFAQFDPGQFAHLRLPEAEEQLLRRPFSVAGVRHETGEADFIYRIRGKGTKRMRRLTPGSSVNVLCPLGTGYRVPSETSSIWLVGGGVGTAGILAVPMEYPGHDYTSFLGFRSFSCAFGMKELSAYGTVFICTDDDSSPKQMPVTDLVREQMGAQRPDLILACGPEAMYAALTDLAEELEVQVSMEERMGCGTGGCETCVCSIAGTYRKTCTDGPVFDLREVDELRV